MDPLDRTAGLAPATRCMHDGIPYKWDSRPVKTPLVMSNNFHLDPAAGLEHITDEYLYARNASPNVCYLEEMWSIRGRE